MLLMMLTKAGGTIGKYIVKHLQDNGGKQKITAITRKGSKSKLPEGLAVKEVDYDDQSTLISAFKGHDALVITLHARAPTELHNNIVKAAAEAGVPWVLPNEWGIAPKGEAASETMIDKTKYRRYIEEQGLSWVGLTCGFWYEWSLAGSPNRFGFDIKTKSVTFFDQGDVAMSVSTWDKTGRAAAALLQLKLLPDNAGDKSPSLSQYRNKMVYSSSFLLSQKDMFESVKRVTGTSDSDWKISYEPSKDRYKAAAGRLKSGDYGAFVIMMYTRMFYPDAPGNFDDKVINQLLELPKENLDETTKFALQLDEDVLGYNA